MYICILYIYELVLTSFLTIFVKMRYLCRYSASHYTDRDIVLSLRAGRSGVRILAGSRDFSLIPKRPSCSSIEYVLEGPSQG
jgi:hypothetical protein